MAYYNNKIPSDSWFTSEAFLSRAEKKISETETFHEIIWKRIKKKGLYQEKSNQKLSNATNLSSQICSNLKGKDYNPSLQTIIALCIGLEFSAEDAERLLKLKGYALSPEKPLHHIYMDLLHVYEPLNLNIDACNEILHTCGFKKKDLIGSFDWDEL